MTDCSDLAKFLDEEVKDCIKHNLPLSFCCTTCNKEQPLCIECFYLEHDQAHTIYPRTILKLNKHNSTIKFIQQIETQYQEYIRKIDEINNKINEISNIRDTNITFINKIEASIKNRFKYILNVLFEQRNRIQNVSKELLSVIYQLRSICFCKVNYEQIIFDSIMDETETLNKKLKTLIKINVF